jgi:prevent-host-death family protein
MESSKRRSVTKATETEVSATRAQNEFGRLLDRAISGERVVITRHGRPAAVLLSAIDYGRLIDPLPPIEGELDSDVAVRLEKLQAQRGDSYRTLLNDVMRKGLEAIHRGWGEQEGYTIAPHDGGRCYLADLDSTHEALTFGEGEGYR